MKTTTTTIFLTIAIFTICFADTSIEITRVDDFIIIKHQDGEHDISVSEIGYIRKTYLKKHEVLDDDPPIVQVFGKADHDNRLCFVANIYCESNEEADRVHSEIKAILFGK